MVWQRQNVLPPVRGSVNLGNTALWASCFPICKLYGTYLVLRCKLWHASQTTQSIYVACVQCWSNDEDVGSTLYKCYINGLCLLGSNPNMSTAMVRILFKYTSYAMYVISIWKLWHVCGPKMQAILLYCPNIKAMVYMWSQYGSYGSYLFLTFKLWYICGPSMGAIVLSGSKMQAMVI